MITDWASTVKAYDIEGDQIVEQATAENLANHGGAVGLALDPDSEILFVTYESSNIIEMVNAMKMVCEGNPVTVTGSYSLVGIAFDQTKQKLYVLKRQDNRLYVYLWDPVRKKLTLEGDTYKTLENIGTYPNGAYGIALDENKERLYVSNKTSSVHYYDTNSWNHVDSVDMNRVAVGIAVDPNRYYLYTGSWSGTSGDHTFLVRTDISDINNPTFDEYNVGAYVIGLTADEQTGFVYITDKSNEIKVFNTSTFPSDPCYSVDANIDEPRDIIVRGDVSYKPPLLTLNKVDVNEPNSVLPGDYITYTITYGPNGVDHNNVVITDYLPFEVTYEFIDWSTFTSDPNYDPNNHTYTWEIGPLDANDPNDSVTLTVKVNEGADPNGVITNYCEIESDSAFFYATADTNVGSWQPDSEIIYVDSLSPCAPGTGMSWRFAYRDLQDALEMARGGCGSQIWVAQGTYKPTAEHGDRDATFELADGRPMYGGFAGTETTLDQRDWMTNETVLSGDINGGGRDIDDVWHVVTALDVNEATIDGFIVTMGWDAGIYSNGGSLNIQQNKISENGNGIYCEDSNSNIANCLIEHNVACGIECTGTSSVTIANN